MKLFLNIFGSIFIVLSLLLLAGAANDCDGGCMENANSIVAMSIIMFAGLAGIITGVMCVVTADKM